MNPTNKPLSIQLNGKRQQLVFDMNTFVAFEEVTNKSFFEVLSSMQESLASAKKATDSNQETATMDLLRRVSLRDVRALLWAAMHSYVDKKPFWPLTIWEVGALVDVNNMANLMSSMFTGAAQNLPEPDATEEGEQAGTTPRPTIVPAASAGGPAFGPSDEEVLASMTMKSDA